MHPLHKLRLNIDSQMTNRLEMQIEMQQWVPEYRPLIQVALVKLPASKCAVAGDFKHKIERILLASPDAPERIGKHGRWG